MKKIIDKGTISFQIFKEEGKEDSFIFQPILSEEFKNNTNEEKGQFLHLAGQWCENNSEKFKSKNFGKVDGDMFEYKKRKSKEKEYNELLKREKDGKIIIEVCDDFLGDRYIKLEQDEDFINNYSLNERNDIIEGVGNILLNTVKAK